MPTKLQKSHVTYETSGIKERRVSLYSVDSIKHTVLLKVLLQIFLLVSIKSTVHWKFSRQINLRTVSIKNTVFNSVQCTLVCIHSR